MLDLRSEAGKYYSRELARARARRMTSAAGSGSVGTEGDGKRDLDGNDEPKKRRKTSRWGKEPER